MTNKVHEFPFSIAYADTDAGGIVYHARYVEIAERARMKWMMDTTPQNGDIGFVIKKLSVQYIKPLRLADDFVIETRLAKLGSASLEVEQKFVKDNEIYAILHGIAAYIGADMKPKRIPENIIKILK
ncbi:MAG: thioesterase family protein [Alphaproteobacteria bacterium]|nr:thioesterase family protein [Alphaproteobacteria bacterium]MBN2674959.1 thioesterase family protein [Alphaproteobacteria bacterium]